MRTNRVGGPERVSDGVQKRAPAGFKAVNDVPNHDHRRAIVGGCALVAGFSQVTR